MSVLRKMEVKDGDLLVDYYQDCQDIIDRNKALQNEPQKSDWGRHIGTIPNGILLHWMVTEGVNLFALPADEFGRYIKRKLDDPDWRFLRTDR